jgi:hypothetical protein
MAPAAYFAGHAMKPSLNVNMLQLQFVGMLLLGLGFSAYVGAAIGNQDTKLVALIIGAVVAIAVLLRMGKHYWMLIPVAMMSDLPAIPIAGRIVSFAELSMAACIAVFMLRLAMRREKFRLTPLMFFILLGALWIVFIYARNPVGFAFLGASAAGARDYQRIFLGICSFIVISNQKIGDREAKWLIIAWIVAPIIAAIYAAVGYLVFGIGTEMVADPGENEYTWHQAMGFPAYCIVIWLFSKYPPSEVFSPVAFGRMAIFFSCAAVALYSGKRAAFGTLLLTPFISALLRKEWAHLVAYAVLGACGVGILVIGHGNFVELPFRVQRSLANLPGEWDPGIKNITAEGADSFRETMRELAWNRIKANPLVGKGIGIRAEDFAGVSTANFAQQDVELNLALGSSWHNTWLGLWADFGLPSVLFHAVIVIMVLLMAVRNFQHTIRSSNVGVLSMILLLIVIFTILRSYTSGSSNVAINVYWQFGLIAAIAGSLAATKDRKATPRTMEIGSKYVHRSQELIPS